MSRIQSFPTYSRLELTHHRHHSHKISSHFLQVIFYRNRSTISHVVYGQIKSEVLYGETYIVLRRKYTITYVSAKLLRILVYHTYVFKNINWHTYVKVPTFFSIRVHNSMYVLYRGQVWIFQ